MSVLKRCPLIEVFIKREMTVIPKNAPLGAYMCNLRQNYLKEFRRGDFQVFWSKLPQIRTKYLCRTQNTYGTLKGRYQVNLQEKINHNQSFSEFSETEAINLKKVSLIFSRWSSAPQDTYFNY